MKWCETTGSSLTHSAECVSAPVIESGLDIGTAEAIRCPTASTKRFQSGEADKDAQAAPYSLPYSHAKKLVTYCFYCEILALEQGLRVSCSTN